MTRGICPVPHGTAMRVSALRERPYSFGDPSDALAPRPPVTDDDTASGADTTRRRFLAHSSLGILGALATSESLHAATTQSAALQDAARPRPLLAAVPTNAPVLKWTPGHE